MIKPLSTAIVLLLLLITHLLNAQENKPLINSGEEIKAGIKLYEEGKYKDAHEKFSKISENDTNYVWALYEQGLTCSADSQFIKGLGYCKEALAIPGNKELFPDILTLQGELYNDNKEYEKALAIFDSAITIYPAYTSLYLGKGNTLFSQKKYLEASKIFQQGLLINPYSPTLHYNLGISALRLGNPVAAFLSLTGSLLISPESIYANNCITLLSNISLAKDDVIALVNNRTTGISENFTVAEEILISKIALEKNYKPLIKLDDAISRQMQVLFEKLDYSSKDNDFWMQYYVPYYRQVFTQNKFELLVNYAFSGVNIEMIRKFNKDNKKEIEKFTDELVVYFNLIRKTREPQKEKREDVQSCFYFSNNKLVSKGIAKDNGNLLLGAWEFYYPAGNLKSKGNFNDKGEKNGPWKYYHFDGKLNGEEYYENGKQEGEEVYYYDNGLPYYHATYKNGKMEGKKLTYYKEGALSLEEEYKNGELNGFAVSYYPSGNKKYTVNYIDDKLDGSFTTFYTTGKREKMGRYSKGLLSGPYKTYYPSGVLSLETQYEKDNIEGSLKAYFENGKLKRTEFHKDGKLDGEYAEYYDNGQLNYRYNSKNGSSSGDISYYDADGILMSILNYNNDKLISAKYFDKKGKELSTSGKNNGNLEIMAYTPDGYKQSFNIYDEKGNRTGTRQLFFKSGAVSETNEYAEGELNGTVISYASNGQQLSSVNFKKGQKNGYYIENYLHGSRSKEGWYIDDQAQGQWIYYDEQNTAVNISNFLNDELHGVKTENWPNGKLESKEVYDHGSLREIIQYDTLGHEFNSIKLNNGSGKYLLLHFNGKPYMEGHFVHGSLDGRLSSYYYDGSLQATQYYKGGLLDSTYKLYYYGGKPRTEGQYSMGEKTAKWNYYSPDGKKYSTEIYKDGILQDTMKYFYANGKTDMEISYKDGERDGMSNKYNEDGILIFQIRYKEGMPEGYSYLNDQSKLVPEIPIPGSNGKVKTFYPNGKPAAEFEYVDGKVNGKDITYFSSGNTYISNTQHYGNSEGLLQIFYPGGGLKSEYRYLHDNVNGPYREVNKSGITTEEGSYYNGTAHGDFRYYNESGKLTETRSYYYGQLLSSTK